MIGLSLFRRRVAFALGLTAAVLTTVTAESAGAQSRRRTANSDSRARVDTTLAFDKNGTVTVTATSGDIVITGWSRAEAHVRAVSDDDNLRFSSSSSRLSLDISGSRRGSDTRFEVSVPYGVRVIARTQSGDIAVRGTRGEVEAHAQNGDVHVEDVAARLDVVTISGEVTAANISGDVEISTISGDIRVTDLRGNADIGAVSGDVELRGITGKVVRVKTTNGDVNYDGLIDPAGRYEFGSHSGDITLHVPRDASAQLTVSTWSGGIDSQFPITLKPGEHGIGASNAKRFTFEIGGGAARIAAETFSGDITISSNGRGASERR
ncbi:MAG: DUF4097 family beta strand repeat-containing protein [bacterium]